VEERARRTRDGRKKDRGRGENGGEREQQAGKMQVESRQEALEGLEIGQSTSRLREVRLREKVDVEDRDRDRYRDGAIDRERKTKIEIKTETEKGKETETEEEK
jgi:hypothetical protein